MKTLSMSSPEGVAWLAGILEGEGTFSYLLNKKWRKKQGSYWVRVYPRVQLQSCDRDVVVKVAALVGVKVLGPHKLQRSAGSYCRDVRALCWIVSFAGEKARLVQEKVLPYMSARRVKTVRASWRLSDKGSQIMSIKEFERFKRPAGKNCDHKRAYL